MAFPKTRDEMIAQGYQYDNHADCRGCGENIEWYTTPRGKKMPFNHMQGGDSEVIAHFTTCPKADSFRRAR